MSCGNFQHHGGCDCDRDIGGASKLPAALDALSLVTSERDRYRKALEKIAKMDMCAGSMGLDRWLLDVAKEALNHPTGDKGGV